MGDVFVCFECPKETTGRSGVPVSEGLGFWKSIKGGIELHCVKVLNIVFEPP